MEKDDIYTNDGTLDINKKPANKETTGHWKACRYILGMILPFSPLNFVVATVTCIYMLCVITE